FTLIEPSSNSYSPVAAIRSLALRSATKSSPDLPPGAAQDPFGENRLFQVVSPSAAGAPPGGRPCWVPSDQSFSVRCRPKVELAGESGDLIAVSVSTARLITALVGIA